jgi:VIT1/CCC1 family predicted Fe2+/Mn2+ transporter
VLSARLGGSPAGRAVIRVLIGGTAGLAFTYGIGHLFGAAISQGPVVVDCQGCGQEF